MAKARDRRQARRKAAAAPRQKAGNAAGRAPEAAEALVAAQLVGLPAFAELEPTEAQRDAYGPAAQRVAAMGLAPLEELALGSVVRLDRGFPAVATERGTLRCEYGQGLSSLKTDVRAAVGDWVVCVLPEGHDMGIVQAVLPRTSDIARWRGSARGERQTLAANVDVVLVAQPLSAKEVALDRIARSCVVARDCGAHAAVVLTKADRCPTAEWLAQQVIAVHEVLGGTVPVVCTAAHEAPGFEQAARAQGAGWGTEDVRALVPAGKVGIVLGESGAGKSTLLNALVGEQVLETQDVRATDDAGRHTTVTRRMVKLPGAGVIVDEPGLRSLPLVGHEHGLAKVFPEVVEAARGCRFRDCTHTGEPGCGVAEAFAHGEFPERRLKTYLALAGEMRRSADSLDPDVVI